MDEPEPGSHSFVVRLWLEEAVADANQSIWRGHITHVLTGSRSYLTELGGIIEFIALYLDQGADVTGPGRRPKP